jgi:hypothetical protein
MREESIMTRFTLDSTPEHYSPGADTNHFLGLCEECDAWYLSVKPLDEAEEYYRQGMISQDEWEAFAHVWSTAAFHYSDFSRYQAAPESPAALRVTARLRGILESRRNTA